MTTISTSFTTPTELIELAQTIKTWGKALGFSDLAITDTDLTAYHAGYFNWIEQAFHGEMHYMAQNQSKRLDPAELHPNTLRVISVRMNYLDFEAENPIRQLKAGEKAYISRYALNKDYHKFIRKRLQRLAEQINDLLPHQFRVFCDSAPVLERPLAEKAGLGFIGKNSLLIHPRAGSFFFLAELYTNLPLPTDQQTHNMACGPCQACRLECPTQAIIADGVVDARRCISYLTIEYAGVIDESLRPLMGNRIYGCDDCQLVCPWNRFSDETLEPHFKANAHQLDQAHLLTLFQWNEDKFLTHLAGSPIRRIGFERWQRNLAIALGNAPYHPDLLQQLETQPFYSDLVQTHIDWAIQQQKQKQKQKQSLPNTPEIKNKKPVKAAKYYLPAKITRLTSRSTHNEN